MQEEKVRRRRPKPKKTMRQMRRIKLRVASGMLLAALLALTLRMVSIYRVHGQEYQKIVLSNRQYDSTILPYRRGDIVDSKGTVLATSEKVYNLVVDASVITYGDDDKYLEPTLRELGNCFPQLDMAEIRYYVLNHENSQYYVPSVTRRMPYSEISEFLNIQKENDFVRGIYFEEEYKRVYPNGTLASTILGFTRNNGNAEGQYGLEEYYNDVLSGSDGREYGYQNEYETLERTVKPAVDGYTIHTTIDANIQSVVEKYLEEYNETYHDRVRAGNGAENVACIVMDVHSGEILAMANYPDYDPNNYKDTTPLLGTNLIEAVENAAGYTEYRKTPTIITPEILNEISEEQKNINLSALWKNFCISNTYEPGSTMKPFTVAAALEDGTIHDGDVFACDGALEVGDHKIKCHTYESGGDGMVTVQDSIAWSCNVALMKIGLKMGREELVKFQRTFNFGLKTNIDLAGEARTASLVYDASNMLPTDLATNTFGQNMNVTMIQMIAGYCSLINGGYYYEPHIVDKITNSAGATIRNIEPRILRQTVSESTSALIRRYTRAVVMPEGGDGRTGKTARPAGYAIGGKTGTAETLPRGNREYVVSFMGHAPADDPQIAIYVVVDRPNESRQDDAKFATRIVRGVLTEVLPYMGIYMTEPLSDKEIQELEERRLENTYKPSQEGESEIPVDTSRNLINGETFVDITGERGNVIPEWMTYDIDPATGYRISPEGKRFDASTGDPIDTETESLGTEVPVTGNLTEGQVYDTSGQE